MNEQYKSPFHRRINELFSRAKDLDYKITHEDYSERLGITRASLRGWLKGAGEPNSVVLKRISEIENVSSDWLIGITDDPTPVQILLDKVSKLEKNHIILGDTPATPKQEALASMDDKLKLLPKEVQQKIISAANALFAVEKEIREDQKSKK